MQRALRRLTAMVETAAATTAATALGIAVLAGAGAALLRYIAGIAVPDGFDIVRLTGGIAACWGIAAAIAADDLIRIDLIAGLGRRAGRLAALTGAIGLAAGGLLLARSGVLGAMSLTYSGETTADLQMPLWPAHLVMAAGLAVAALAGLCRMLMAVLPPEPVDGGAP
ncbi:hypothetical protein GCM10011505_28250 [Tistrella bauzanensis]|uniref:TRAP transporter small permease protein n=1 Tax=Tistrella bauzanensis TaxID=657419 RepID=A0ABQ1IKY7_9PROT|nr:TRAP transporter small permease subunit [Tistrella bauzanensis]GGB45337.1 hypothetical protein GCM10011505_28250 [Tistrella bauzanensis]